MSCCGKRPYDLKDNFDISKSVYDIIESEISNQSDYLINQLVELMDGYKSLSSHTYKFDKPFTIYNSCWSEGMTSFRKGFSFVEQPPLVVVEKSLIIKCELNCYEEIVRKFFRKNKIVTKYDSTFIDRIYDDVNDKINKLDRDLVLFREYSDRIEFIKKQKFLVFGELCVKITNEEYNTAINILNSNKVYHSLTTLEKRLNEIK